MSYKTKELEQKVLECIKENKLVFWNEIPVFLHIAKVTLYNHKLEESAAIQAALHENKVNIKSGLRKKWYDNQNPITQLALYKLVADEDEADRINSTKQKLEHSFKKPIKGITFDEGDE